jgi:hypothetical protein
MPDKHLPKLSVERGQAFDIHDSHLISDKALVFENRDADFVDEWTAQIPGIDQDHLALMCYWIDEKLVRTRELTRTAQIYRQYEDVTDGSIIDILVIRPDFHFAEPVAAMISRAASYSASVHVQILTNHASLQAFTHLGELLRGVSVVSLRLVSSLIDVERVLEDAVQEQQNVITQLSRDRRMPNIISRRVFGNPPEPGPKNDDPVRVL